MHITNCIVSILSLVSMGCWSTTEIPLFNETASNVVNICTNRSESAEKRLEKLLSYTDCIREFSIRIGKNPMKNSCVFLSNYPHCREKEIAKTDSYGRCKINFSSVFLAEADMTNRDTLESVVAEYASLVWLRSTSQERYGIPIGTLFEGGFSEISIPDSHEKVLHIDRGQWNVKEVKVFFWSQNSDHFAYTEGNADDEGFLKVSLIPGLSYFYVTLALSSDYKRLMMTPKALYQNEEELNLSSSFSFHSTLRAKEIISLNTWHLSPIRESPYEDHVYPVSILDPRILHFADKSRDSLHFFYKNMDDFRDTVDIFYFFEDNDVIGEVSSKYVMFFNPQS